MITSTHNPKIQQARSLLARAKERRETGLFVVEGVRLAEEAVQSGWPVHQVLYSQAISPRGLAVVEQFRQQGAPVEEVLPGILEGLADTDTPQGILAVLAAPQPVVPDCLDFAVIADTIRDPGNLGTLLRTAAAAGAQAVFTSPGTTDAFAPKVVRAGMGAHFHLPVLALEWEALRQAVGGLQVVLADMDGEQVYWQADFRRPCAIMVSNEAAGASAEGRALANQVVRIPMPGQSESLNAAVAAGILIYEAVRQRSLTGET